MYGKTRQMLSFKDIFLSRFVFTRGNLDGSCSEFSIDEIVENDRQATTADERVHHELALVLLVPEITRVIKFQFKVYYLFAQ